MQKLQLEVSGQRHSSELVLGGLRHESLDIPEQGIGVLRGRVGGCCASEYLYLWVVEKRGLSAISFILWIRKTVNKGEVM